MSELSQAQNLITPKNQISLIGILLCAFSAPLIMPLNIIAISQRFIDATNGQIGTIATFETLSISVASIILSRIVNRLDRKKIFITAAVLVILGNILTILVPTLNYVILARVISGLGSGAIVATVVATIARGSNAQMTFALLNSGVGVMGVLLPFCLPIIIASNGMNGAYSFHLFISLFIFLFISFLTLSSGADDNQNTVSSYKGYAGWASMIGTSLIFLGHAGIFAFSAKIGATLGISVIQVGYVFMAGGLLTIFGPLLAGFIGQRFGSLLPCLILITILLVFILPIIDTTSVVINRIARKNSPFIGGKDHTTHHLSYMGFTDSQISFIFAGISFLSCLIAIALYRFVDQWNWINTSLFLLYFLGVFCSLFFTTQQHKDKRK